MTVLMHCPSCGHQSTLEQKFCRQCGFNLEPISKLVATSSESDRKLDLNRDRLILRRMIRWMMSGCLILLIGLVMLATGRSGLFELPRFLGPLTTLLLLGGTAIAGYGVLAALRDGLSSARVLPRRSSNKLSASTTTELPDQGVPIEVPSVTERSTQLIERGHQPIPDDSSKKTDE